jgi:hypothetical protein
MSWAVTPTKACRMYFDAMRLVFALRPLNLLLPKTLHPQIQSLTTSTVCQLNIMTLLFTSSINLCQASYQGFH